jgi:hypothetical protein
MSGLDVGARLVVWARAIVSFLGAEAIARSPRRGMGCPEREEEILEGFLGVHSARGSWADGKRTTREPEQRMEATNGPRQR